MWCRRMALTLSIVLALGIAIPTAAGGATSGWKQVNKDGFGDDGNNTAFSMVVYSNTLLVGTINPGGSQLWTNDGSKWEQIDISPFTSYGTMMASFAVFKNQLYIGTHNASTGCQVWRLDGTTLTLVNQDGFGDANNMDASSMCAYNGKLYVGTSQPSDGTGGEVWRTSGTGEAPFTDWEQVNTDGFGDVNNTGAVSMSVYGNLYVGTRNKTEGSQVWRYNGFTWSTANTNGFGEVRNSGATSMSVLGSRLYVGTENEGTGCQIWRYDGDTWTKEDKDGFGDRNNTGAMSMTIFNANLHVGTRNAKTGCEVWRLGGGDPLPPPAPPPVLPSTFYFAEGYTGAGFQEYLCIGNAGASDAKADVVYLFPDGTSQQASYVIPAESRFTVDVNGVVGPDREVSISVLSEAENLIAERPMYFNYQGAWSGGSDAVGAASPSLLWYFAEGTTLPGFDEYITVLNPGANEAHLTFHYMIEGTGEAVFMEAVKPLSRATFNAVWHVGVGKNISLFVESDQYVVAERPMYFDYPGLSEHHWTGGHVVLGANAPAKKWYLAEGTTRAGFEEWLCIQNPGNEAMTVDALYMVGEGQGGPISKSYKVPAKQRLTVCANLEIGPEKDVSVLLTSKSDFLAERPMYFLYHNAWDGGHDVVGTGSPATEWFFAEGYTGSNFEEWLCVQNPGAANANLQVTYLPTGRSPIQKSWVVPAQTRLTIPVNHDAGANLEISMRITSDQPVICERPMYFNFRGLTGGHDVMGYVPARD